MNHRSRLAVITCSLLAAAIGAHARPPQKMESSRADNPTDAALLVILQEDLEAQRVADPLEASRRGDRRFDDRWPDLSPAAQTAWIEGSRARLIRLSDLDLSALSDEHRVSAELLRWTLERRIEAEPFKLWQMSVTQQAGPQNSIPQLPDFLSFTTAEHLEDYLTRLETLPAYLDQIVANLRAGLAEGRTPPRVVMGTTPDQALAHGDDRYLTEPQAHVLYRPLIGSEPADSERARRAISERVVPAFKNFGRFLRDEYLPACRTTIAAADLPDGRALYDYRIRLETTTAMSAQQIHDLGLSEVARIRAEMMGVIARSDFARKDSLSGEPLFRAFVEYLRTDPRFYHRTAEDLLAGYREIAKRIDADMPRLFRTLPRLSYGVREMPRFIAAAAPTAYYYAGSISNGVPGYFIANTSALDQRPRYEMIALTLHEAVPGHHHQFALADELASAGLPEWRTTVDFTVFTEGWGLYAERLGLEMGDDPRSLSNPEGLGMYTDPYDNFGRLSYEMWRAMRLVVDTGIHALGWTRERAIQYMLDNSALSKANIEREVDRYIVWPGQALAYKIGELRIRELRDRAERKLGAKFDVRGFHDAVLLQGAVPLDQLERQVDRWIENTARN